jgi:hypothetical protein
MKVDKFSHASFHFSDFRKSSYCILTYHKKWSYSGSQLLVK